MAFAAGLLLMVGGVVVLIWKAGGELCPRCGHWDRNYPMCRDPWHLEKSNDPDTETRRPNPD